MKKMFIVAALCTVAFVSGATQYSKLAVITAAKQAGKWGAIKGWITSAGLTDEFQNCVYLSDEFPQFVAITNAIVEAGIATAPEIVAIMEASKDTAISDALLRRVYDSDMGSESGRVKWHGKVVSTVFDTNALVKVQVHADGFRHEQKFATAQAIPIDQKISSAERKAAREAAAKAAAARKEKIRLDRIACLQTNMTAEVSKLMSAKKWPEDLAAAWLKNELNNLIGTQTVTGVVTPQ